METLPLEAADHTAIVAHIEAVTPLLLKAFGEIPLIYATYPRGLGAPPTFHAHLENGPATISTKSVRTASGVHRFVEMSMHNVVWLARGRYAVELHSWSPSPSDPEEAAFARITLEANGAAGPSELTTAARMLREELNHIHLDAVALLDGVCGITLWIPVANAPGYAALADWLHTFVARCAQRHPGSLTVAPLRADRGDRVYLSVRTNHPGMATILPYQVRGLVGLPVAVPAAWEDLDATNNGAITAANFAQWQTANGDLFATLRDRIGPQTLPASAPNARAAIDELHRSVFLQALNLPADTFMQPPSPVMTNVLQLLADGKPHSADDLYDRGIALGYFKHTTRKHLYTDIYEYIARTQGIGRKPDIVQDPITKSFRLNRPLDLWPAVTFDPLPQFIDPATVETLVRNLTAAATGDDPTAFEVATCDAFAALGFAATHYGGNGEPDGTLDAPLGVDAYRVILECKTATHGAVVSNPRPEEPDSYRTSYRGTYAIVIGPAFSNDATLNAELLTHRVALWTVDDLVSMLRAQVGPQELLSAFTPGRAEDACTAILWEREHGRRRRIAVLKQYIFRIAWQSQAALVRDADQTAIPPLTHDTLTFLVDENLIHEGLPIADPAELQAALNLLTADGIIAVATQNPAAYIATQPAPSGPEQ